MEAIIIVIFGIVYLGMLFGRIPGLALDRAGVAVLGAIALIATGQLSPDAAWLAVDVPTISLLFGLMVVSAQFRFSGFYSALGETVAAAPLSPAMLLALLIGVVGILSALLANDIVCLAMTPVLIDGCARRGLDPKPFLLALACAANVGSAATIIGNPQNMLIGQAFHLHFRDYLVLAGPPTAMGLVVIWALIRSQVRGRWFLQMPISEIALPAMNRWQTFKGGLVLVGLIASFLTTSWPREVPTLAAAGVLLASRQTSSRDLLDRVDWQVLTLFIGLFVVNHAVARVGLLDHVVAGLEGAGIQLTSAAWLYGVTAALSNLFSNVPAVMLLLPMVSQPAAGPILALSSTLAGNLLIAGSIANMIVVEQASKVGVHITWRQHARVGIPVTLATLALTWFWLTRVP